MKIETAQYIKLSDIATVLGVDVDELAELADGEFSWGDTDCALITLPKFLGLLEEAEEEAVMEALWDIIRTETKETSRYFVDLAS